MLLVLALIPAIGLLITIYCCDRNKEPKWLLIVLFFAGMSTTIGSGIAEMIGEYALENIGIYDDMLEAAINAIAIIGPVEEIGKFIVVFAITWRNRHFDYLFDGIVYCVASSLGFAALENVLYVCMNGVTTGIVRMFSSVPGHMCFAVFMGYFYSQAKYAFASGKKLKCALNMALTLAVPSLIHGIYDALLFVGQASNDDAIEIISLVVWIVVLIALFVVTIIMIVKTSRNDYCIIILPNKTQVAYRPTLLGTWQCTCGSINDRNFCGICGNKRPFADIWYCPTCGSRAFSKFCGQCGTPRVGNTVGME